MELNVVVNLKWYCFSQNNSGGYFIQNETIAPVVFIQARSADEAITTAQRLFEDHSDYCECCGERWNYWVDESDGYDVPTLYGEPYQPGGLYREYAILHYFDGRVETIK